MRFHHLALLFPLLTVGLFPSTAGADATRIAVIYAKADDVGALSFDDVIGGIEETPGLEVVRLTLEDFVRARPSALLMANANRGGMIRLAAAGNLGQIVVLYPDIGEPYRSVFSKIIEGIEENTKTKVTSYAVGRNFNPQAVSEELKRQDIRIVIALGRNGLKAAGALDKNIGVLAGGVISVPEAELRGGAALSLAPDPAQLFARLKALAPKTRRVFVVYDPAQNNWLIKLARDAARSHGIELVAREAGDLKTALGLYQSIFANADPKQDALWLPQDSNTVDESLVLPLVLQESWTKNLAVFSSNVSHVKRGVLFALYPNNEELGKNLAVSALGMANGDASVHGVLPLRDVLTAFNTRTASHLGLSPSLAQQGFDLLFPEQ